MRCAICRRWPEHCVCTVRGKRGARRQMTLHVTVSYDPAQCAAVNVLGLMRLAIGKLHGERGIMVKEVWG